MRLPLRWRCGVAVLAALAFALGYILLCERVGRLSMDLEYDDVSYAIDASERLDTWREGGLVPLAAGLVVEPPHSPFSTALAVAAFALMGEHDLSLYLANVVLLIAAGLLVVAVTRERDDSTFLLALGLVLASPLAYFAQTEFRPDIGLGLAMAAMVWTFVAAALDGRRSLARWAGVLFGVCLWLKPSFFAHTLVLALLLAGVGLATRLRAVRRWVAAPMPVEEIAGFLAIGVVIALPYYAIGGKEIFLYFWQATLGKYGRYFNLPQDLAWWHVPGALLPYMIELPRWHLVLEAAAPPLLAATLAWRGLGREALRVALLIAFAGVSGAIIMAGRQPSQFFFSTMHWCLVLATIAGFAALAASVRPWSQRIAVAAAAVAVVSLAVVGLREVHSTAPGLVYHGASWNERAAIAIRDDMLRRRPGKPIPALGVMIDSAGAVNPQALRWVGRLAGLTLLTKENDYLASHVESLQDEALVSDYLVLVAPAHGIDSAFPIGALQGAVLDWAKREPRLQLIEGGATGDPYAVFANTEFIRRFDERFMPAVDGAVLSVKGLAGSMHDAQRPLDPNGAKVCAIVPVGQPTAVRVRLGSSSAGVAELRRDGRLVATAPVAASVPTEVGTQYYQLRHGGMCAEVAVRAAPGAPSPRVQVHSFDVRRVP